MRIVYIVVAPLSRWWRLVGYCEAVLSIQISVCGGWSIRVVRWNLMAYSNPVDIWKSCIGYVWIRRLNRK